MLLELFLKLLGSHAELRTLLVTFSCVLAGSPALARKTARETAFTAKSAKSSKCNAALYRVKPEETPPENHKNMSASSVRLSGAGGEGRHMRRELCDERRVAGTLAQVKPIGLEVRRLARHVQRHHRAVAQLIDEIVELIDARVDLVRQ